MYDVDGNGEIDKNEMHQIIQVNITYSRNQYQLLLFECSLILILFLFSVNLRSHWNRLGAQLHEWPIARRNKTKPWERLREHSGKPRWEHGRCRAESEHSHRANIRENGRGQKWCHHRVRIHKRLPERQVPLPNAYRRLQWKRIKLVISF